MENFDREENQLSIFDAIFWWKKLGICQNLAEN